MTNKFPPAIPDVDILFRELRFYELHEQVTVFEDYDRQIVHPFRRSFKIELEGQVKLDV